MRREEAMRRHPAHQSRLVPESPEVAHARMDDEACRITWGEHRHHVSTSRYGWAIDAAVVVALIGALALLMLGVTVLGELAGGWPA